MSKNVTDFSKDELIKIWYDIIEIIDYDIAKETQWMMEEDEEFYRGEIDNLIQVIDIISGKFKDDD